MSSNPHSSHSALQCFSALPISEPQVMTKYALCAPSKEPAFIQSDTMRGMRQPWVGVTKMSASPCTGSKILPSDMYSYTGTVGMPVFSAIRFAANSLFPVPVK